MCLCLYACSFWTSVPLLSSRCQALSSCPAFLDLSHKRPRHPQYASEGVLDEALGEFLEAHQRVKVCFSPRRSANSGNKCVFCRGAVRFHCSKPPPPPLSPPQWPLLLFGVLLTASARGVWFDAALRVPRRMHTSPSALWSDPRRVHLIVCTGTFPWPHCARCMLAPGWQAYHTTSAIVHGSGAPKEASRQLALCASVPRGFRTLPLKRRTGARPWYASAARWSPGSAANPKLGSAGQHVDGMTKWLA